MPGSHFPQLRCLDHAPRLREPAARMKIAAPWRIGGAGDLAAQNGVAIDLHARIGHRHSTHKGRRIRMARAAKQ